jgi:hypothetical protein
VILSIRFSGSEMRSSVEMLGKTLEERLDLHPQKNAPERHTPRVTADLGCCPAVEILAKFSPDDQHQSVAGCSVFDFAGGENFSDFGASRCDHALRSRPGPVVATKACATQVWGGWGVVGTPHGCFKCFWRIC